MSMTLNEAANCPCCGQPGPDYECRSCGAYHAPKTADGCEQCEPEPPEVQEIAQDLLRHRLGLQATLADLERRMGGTFQSLATRGFWAQAKVLAQVTNALNHAREAELAIEQLALPNRE